MFDSPWRWLAAAGLVWAASLGLLFGWTGTTRSRPGAQQAPAPTARREPIFAGLGDLHRPISTASPEAQGYFDQGLAFLYAFNHDEAIRSFRQATELDPECAMAWWGLAVANGPHINKPVVPEDRARAAWEAIEKARACRNLATGVELELIDAQARRFAADPSADRKPLDEAYAAAMRQVWQAHPDDADVGALFAEAVMDLRPWDLWTADGKPQPGTEEAVGVLERVLEIAPDHPLALHLYIHAVEASGDPERAADEADRLRGLQPGLPHLVHMPSHIDVLLGRWEKAADTNDRAIAADRAYRAARPRKQGFYRLYMLHNHHMLTFAAMMLGQSERAQRAVDAMVADVPAEWAQEYHAIVDGYLAVPWEVAMRFGRWDDILAAPEPAEIFPIARALRRAFRGVAYAAKGQLDEARAEQTRFQEACAAVGPEATFGNNKGTDVLSVADRLLEGEVLYREGREEEAFAALREAAKGEDALRYDEPPGWIQPVRHALGAALLQSGRGAEAEQVFREDLERRPENGYGLFGLLQSLEIQGKATGDVRERWERAWKHADVHLKSPCFCQPGR